MERVDAVVAAVGAVIVALAVVGAALSGPVAAQWGVTFTTDDLLAGEGNRRHQAEDVRDSFTFNVAEPNATRLNVTVTVTFLGGPGAQAAMDVLLTAPDGTTYEATGETRAALGGPQAVATAWVDVPLGALPANATVEASSAAEAVERAAPPAGNASWLGEWSLDVSARAGPTPLVQATTAWSATVTSWVAAARPAPAASR